MLNKKIIYIDMDGVLADYMTAFDKAIEMNPDIKFPQATYGFFANLQPITGAIKAVTQLIDDPIFDVHILTSPSVKNPLCYTEKRVWIEKYFNLDLCEKLVIAMNKSLLRGDFLIDDLSTGAGQEDFQGQLILFGSEKYPDWSAVLHMFQNEVIN
jgi:5'-nucleotidase